MRLISCDRAAGLSTSRGEMRRTPCNCSSMTPFRVLRHLISSRHKFGGVYTKGLHVRAMLVVSWIMSGLPLLAAYRFSEFGAQYLESLGLLIHA